MTVDTSSDRRTSELIDRAVKGESRWQTLRRRFGVWGMPVLALLGLVVTWEAIVRLFDTPSWLVPSPSDIGRALWEDVSRFWGHFYVTLSETVIGFAAAVILGIPLAIVIVYSRFLERTVYPILVAMQSVPKIAVAPILVLWMGFGLAPKVVLIILLAIFPIVISTATGLKSAPREFVEVVQSLGVSSFAIFRRVRFPASIPQIFVGLKVAVSLSVIGAVIGEFVGANQGLGFVIIISQGNLRTDRAFAAMLLLSVMSIVLFYLLVWLERMIVPWAESEE